ncbi:MSP domain-containing protein [Schizosaccharomyces cryophilus OY26]|uniref:MSP domain-containing protein n=1 Tax=Schizosaccharomyces cryophilus (strain OY26 / ATCC MYA-4695 / CBS 11777 / NBRC 106824 / NRRL Y48691) TaxID=653667 RepID=S9VVU3_SCHCR|nr:MSP domain-containing protein [Schizosaccharomyces cryophilus OY26]EPY50280.1 MSP domain-containing protein [Schizosaccharomyces cryophilus OY26]
MSIECSGELYFYPPFTTMSKELISVYNPNPEPVIFKVKTTAPKQYCVRPNSGRIDAKSSVNVQVLLQAMKEEPAPDFKCRDKFLIQSMAIGNESTEGVENYQEFWSEMEKHRNPVHDRKIRCVYSVNQAPGPASSERQNENTADASQATASSEAANIGPGGIAPTAAALSLEETKNDVNNDKTDAAVDDNLRSAVDDAGISQTSDKSPVNNTEQTSAPMVADDTENKAQNTVDTSAPEPVRRTISSTPPSHPPPPVPKEEMNNFVQQTTEATPSGDAASSTVGNDTREAIQGDQAAVAPSQEKDAVAKETKPTFSAEPSTVANAAMTNTPGIPPNVVVVLCLIFFLIGYLFF